MAVDRPPAALKLVQLCMLGRGTNSPLSLLACSSNHAVQQAVPKLTMAALSAEPVLIQAEDSRWPGFALSIQMIVGGRREHAECDSRYSPFSRMLRCLLPSTIVCCFLALCLASHGTLKRFDMIDSSRLLQNLGPESAVLLARQDTLTYQQVQPKQDLDWICCARLTKCPEAGHDCLALCSQ